MHPEYDRGSTDHAYIVHNDLYETTNKDASDQCFDNYDGATLPVLDSPSKHRAAFGKMLTHFRNDCENYFVY